jgi:hypothetical protein
VTDLYDEILSEQPVAICKFGKLLRDLDPDDKAVLNRRGHHIDRDTLSRHAREKCACFRR